VAGSCEHGNKPLGTIKHGEYLGPLNYSASMELVVIMDPVISKPAN